MKPIGVSVVLTTYNRPEMLARILSGIARQTYKKIEVLVVDDHSADHQALLRAVKPFRSKITGFRLLRNDRNRGTQFSRNRAIRAARYPLIALADDDDEWKPEKLGLQERLFRRNWEGTDLVYVWHELRRARKYWNESRKPSKGGKNIVRPRIRGVALREMLKGCFFQISGAMVKRQALLDAGLFDESLPNAQDRDMWIRLFKRGCSCDFVPKVLLVYYVHLDSISYTKSLGLLIVLFKHFPAFIRYSPSSIFWIFYAIAVRNLGRLRRWLESKRVLPLREA